MRYTVYLQNRHPHAGLGYRSPFSVWFGTDAVNVSADKVHEQKFIRVFGCEAFAFVYPELRSKGDSKARRCVFLGVDSKKKGYRVWSLSQKKIVVSGDVVFNEGTFPFIKSSSGLDSRLDNLQVVDPDQSSSPPITPQLLVSTGADPTSALSSNIGADHTDVIMNSTPQASSSSSSVVQPASSVSDSSNESEATGISSASHSKVVVLEAPEPVDEPDQELRNSDHDPVESDQLTGEDSISSRVSGRPSRYVPSREFVESMNNKFAYTYHAGVVSNTGLDSEIVEPESRRQALASPERVEWLKGEQAELQALKECNTWEIVPRKGISQAPISCRWVYRVKRDSENKVAVFKCRLTAKGYQQKEGVDYNETFAAVAQLKSFRLLLALATVFNLRASQLDVKSAFLNGILKETIYMHYPPGYPGKKGTILKLIKCLYGLKQAPRVWFKKLVESLIGLGFRQLVSDICVFVYDKRDVLFFLSFHVDDIVMVTDDENLRTEIVSKLSKLFKMKDLGKLHYYLGIQVSYGNVDGRECIVLHQEAYVARMLARFNMVNCKPQLTPANSSIALSELDQPKTQSELEHMAAIPYRALVGSLLYAMVCTRPDIAQAVITCAQFNTKAGIKHWQAGKRVLRYLAGTNVSGVRYGGASEVVVEAYCDSNWGGDLDNRKSRSGYVVYVGNGPVAWASKTQRTVALSSCEAEYMALTEALKECLWVHHLLTELNVRHTLPITIHVDNQAAIALANNPVAHQRTKHMDIRYHFVREHIASGLIAVRYVPTGDNIADVFTKATPVPVFRTHQPKLVSGQDSLAQK